MLHIEVRRKIIEARKNGLKIRAICKAYSVGKTAVFNLLKQERETGDITPQTHMRGRKPALDEKTLEELKKLLDTHKDISLAEIKEELRLAISIVAISKTIRGKLGYRYKKRQYMPVSETDLMSLPSEKHGKSLSHR